MRINVEVDPVAYARELGTFHTPDGVLEFITDVDEAVADAGFTHDLIYRLSVSLSEESEARGWEKVTILGEGQQVKFSNLYESLSYLDEDKIIALMANAMMVKRERRSEEVSRRPFGGAADCAGFQGE